MKSENTLGTLRANAANSMTEAGCSITHAPTPNEFLNNLIHFLANISFMGIKNNYQAAIYYERDKVYHVRKSLHSMYRYLPFSLIP